MMSNPVIKKEESPEPSAMAMLEIPSAVSPASAVVASAGSTSIVDTKLPQPKPYVVAQQARFAPGAYHGSSPHKYKLSRGLKGSSRVSALAQPVLARLPSRPSSAVATGRVNKPTATNITTSTIPTLIRNNQLLRNNEKHLNEKSGSMEGEQFGLREEVAMDNEMNFQEQGDETVTVQHGHLENRHDHPQLLQNAITARDRFGMPAVSEFLNQQLTGPVSEQGMIVNELVTYNYNLHGMMQQLEHRLHSADAKSQQLDDLMTMFNRNIHGKVQQLDNRTMELNHTVHEDVKQLSDRMAKVEEENTYLRSMLTPGFSIAAYEPQSAPAVRPAWYRDNADGRSRSPSPGRDEYRDRAERATDETATNGTQSGSIKKLKARKQLEISIPDKKLRPLLPAGLPTPLTRTAMTFSTGTPGLSSGFPKTPLTPGRIGPSDFYRRSATSINKRKIHNLEKMMPPANAQMPSVPLTDTEVIVYFFQSLSRPVVALRLYARNWGPRSIVEALNDHREIEPPYLRNTCSVKCTTAIKKGRDKFGEQWEEPMREVFAQANDAKATDLIQLAPDELENAADYDLRALCIGLRKHPQEDVDGGIFTRCVKYCYENNAAYTLSNVGQLMQDLQVGSIPQHPPSPSQTNQFGFSRTLKQKQVGMETDNDNVEPHSPTVMAQRRRTNLSTSVMQRSATPDSGTDEDAAGETE